MEIRIERKEKVSEDFEKIPVGVVFLLNGKNPYMKIKLASNKKVKYLDLQTGTAHDLLALCPYDKKTFEMPKNTMLVIDK